MKDFKKYAVWQKAHTLVLDVYRDTTKLPDGEKFGLVMQIRRAAASIPANIAEGCGRDGDAEFGRFLNIAFGSANELDYHLLLTRDLKLMDESLYSKLNGQLGEVKSMLRVLIRKVKIDSY